ncbi:MAG: ACT domain-containing protein [Chthonomonadales bacterium]
MDPSEDKSLHRVSFERERGVYDVEVVGDIGHVVVKVGAEGDRNDRIARLFRQVADEGIPIFLIKLHRSAVSFAVRGDALERVEALLTSKGERYRARRDLALVNIIASSMRDLIGVMVRIGDALQRAGARVFATGDSHNSVQCLIEEARVSQAVNELRAEFGLGPADA